MDEVETAREALSHVLPPFWVKYHELEQVNLQNKEQKRKLGSVLKVMRENVLKTMRAANATVVMVPETSPPVFVLYEHKEKFKPLDPEAVKERFVAMVNEIHLQQPQAMEIWQRHFAPMYEVAEAESIRVEVVQPNTTRVNRGSVNF